MTLTLNESEAKLLIANIHNIKIDEVFIVSHKISKKTDFLEALQNSQNLVAIKLVKDITHCSLIESKDFCVKVSMMLDDLMPSV